MVEKRGRKFQFNLSLSNRLYYTLILIGILIVGGWVVIAYSSIQNPGHGADTIQVTTTSGEKTLQQAIDDGDFGGGGGNSDWVISGNNMYSGVPGNIGIGTNSPTEVFQVCAGSVCTSVKQTTGNYGSDVYGSWIYDNMLSWETCNDDVNPYTCEPDTFKNCRDYAQSTNCPNAWPMCARDVDCKKEGGLSWVDSSVSILQD